MIYTRLPMRWRPPRGTTVHGRESQNVSQQREMDLQQRRRGRDTPVTKVGISDFVKHGWLPVCLEDLAR